MLDGKLEGSANGDVQKARKELLENNEVTISVSWKGGGQQLKGRKYQIKPHPHPSRENPSSD